MNKIVFALVIVLVCTHAGAQDGKPAEDAGQEQKISYSLLNNDYFVKSMREKNIARLNFEAGAYDDAAFHAAEAEKYAKLSDEYIAKRLLMARAAKALSKANDHVLWARRMEAATYYPAELSAAEGHLQAAVDARGVEDWEQTLENALAVERDLAGVAAPPAKKGGIPPDLPVNPSQYKVRPWDIFGDCFWNIAKWFYKDYRKWRLLYEANIDKIPERDNPDLIEVGTIIDIPSVSGESRVGMYDTGRPYKGE